MINKFHKVFNLKMTDMVVTRILVKSITLYIHLKHTLFCQIVLLCPLVLLRVSKELLGKCYCCLKILEVTSATVGGSKQFPALLKTCILKVLKI